MQSLPENYKSFLMNKLFISIVIFVISLQACHLKNDVFDASGSFEAEEVIVSSQLNGQLMRLNVNEGDSLAQGQVVGLIESESINLQKEQVKATIQSLSEKTSDVAPQ